MENRVQKLIEALPEGFEAALVLSPENRFYFLDCDTHDAGSLLILPGNMVFIIDSRYIEMVQKSVKHAEVLLENDALAQIKELLKKHRVETLYVENTLPLKQAASLERGLPGVALQTGQLFSEAVNALRAIKEPEEAERMKMAQKITDDCFTYILSYIREGMREVDIMLEMERFMRTHGAEKVAFDTICVAGANTSLPHGVPGEYRVQKGDFITMDFGAKYKGYCADMTRTVAMGEPGEEKRKVYDMVLRAHLAGIAAARAGLRGNEVDKVARDIIYGEGYEGYFGHGLGHAVGIEIHEDPRFSPKCTTVIKAGMMMTVEPGCYLPGRFGCRIEDTVLITETGCLPLPASRKQLIVL
ncbi:MAG: M24 family metallopeptidase [Oscillospiraceae bacterium]